MAKSCGKPRFITIAQAMVKVTSFVTVVYFAVFAKKPILANFEVVFLKVLTLVGYCKVAVHRVSDLISSLAVLEFEFKAPHPYNSRFPAALYS